MLVNVSILRFNQFRYTIFFFSEMLRWEVAIGECTIKVINSVLCENDVTLITIFTSNVMKKIRLNYKLPPKFWGCLNFTS